MENEVQDKPAIQDSEEQGTGKFAPKCPYCGDQPIQFRAKMIQVAPGAIVLLAWCGNKECLKTLSVSPVPIPSAPPSIHIPSHVAFDRNASRSPIIMPPKGGK